MLHGTVQYTFKAGGEAGLEWAARAKLVKVDGRVRMRFYQVYLVSTFDDFVRGGGRGSVLMEIGYCGSERLG
jgi:hypothetical protein